MAANQHNEMGWFRTPIAAAMLSGVLTGLMALIAPRIWFSVLSPSVSMGLIRVISVLIATTITAAHLSGPAISERNWRKAILGLRWAFAMGVVMSLAWWVALSVIRPTGPAPFAYGFSFYVLQFAQASVFAMWACRILCNLYGLKERPWSIYIVGALTKGVTSLIYGVLLNAQRTGASLGGMDTQDLDVVTVMGTLIMYVLGVVLPTIFIERQLRKEIVKLTAIPAVVQVETSPHAE
jgi:hypothetical protein